LVIENLDAHICSVVSNPLVHAAEKSNDDEPKESHRELYVVFRVERRVESKARIPAITHLGQAHRILFISDLPNKEEYKAKQIKHTQPNQKPEVDE
jgi:hypothetical protein